MRGGSDPTMMIVILMLMMSSSSSVAAGAYYYLNMGEEGDVCTIEDGDPFGVYKLDEDLKCVKEGCVTDTDEDASGNCVVDLSGTNCTIEEAVDGTLYVTNLAGACEFEMCKETHILAASATAGDDAYCRNLDCTLDPAVTGAATYVLGADGVCRVATCEATHTLNATNGSCDAN